VAVGLNVLAGTTALLISRLTSETVLVSSRNAGENAGAPPDRHLTFLLVAFGVVGATAMAYEICWARLLATILGSSTYAFTLMLGTFLGGIVLGSIVFEHWLRRTEGARLSNFAWTQTLTAVAALLFLIFFQQLPRVVPPLLRATHQSFGGLVLAQFVTSALAMLPAAALFGFNFPLVALLTSGGDSTDTGHARGVGRAYAANTLGAIVGALATGFWLIPGLGSFRVVALAAGVNLLVALAVMARTDAPERQLARAVAINIALLAFV